MSDSRLQRTRELFNQVLDIPPDDRDAFLRDACGSDRELEENVRSLVTAHLKAESFLEGGPALALADFAAEKERDLVGIVIGDYTILGLLGRGGMGAVYRAEQVHPRREVALKLIDRGIATPLLLKRFEVEAQVLARLKHPGIAQIHVAGTTGTEHGDRPYFAMELVDGLPLTEFADSGNLALRDRLELVIRICEAVQYAHQVGVIHRDLKPANILVTADGQPKILDFGIARSTDTDLQVTTMADGQAVLLGTLPYMSPEQVRGNSDELDTRSDVHALGVLCFELLTGSLPRDIAGKPLTDAIRTIDGEEPRSLGEAAGKRFPADLEAIVAKALECDKRRRYDSASGFAEDLRRFLNGHPISARPQSAVYQLRKLVARNRLPAILVAGLVLVAIGSAVLMGFQARRIARERDRANLEATTANQVSLFLENLFLEVNPEFALGEELTALDILERGVERIGTELEDQPEVRGRVLATLGQVYEGLGQSDRAVELLEEAVDIGRALQAEHDEPVNRSNYGLALNLLSGHYTNQGRNEEAIALCREAVELSAFIKGTESALYATRLNYLAYQLTMAGEYDEARELIERGMALREKILGPDHFDVGWSKYQYAWLLRSTGDLSGAREYFEQALIIWEKGLPPNHPQIATCLHDYSSLLTELEEFDAALELAEKALAIQRQTLGAEHPAIAETLSDISYYHTRLGNLSEAHRYSIDAIEAHRTALGEEDPGLLERLYNLAFIIVEMKRPEELHAILQQALALARTHHGDQPAVVGDALMRVGAYYKDSGRETEAIPVYRESVDLFSQAGDAHLHALVGVRDSLARVLSLTNQSEEALSLNQQNLALRLEHPEWESPHPLLIRKQIGINLLLLGRIDEAKTHLRELLTDAERPPLVHRFFPASVRWLLAHCLYLSGAGEEAEALYDGVLEADSSTPEDTGRQDGLDLTEDDFDPGVPPAGAFRLNLRRAEDHAAQGRMDQARRELQAALEAGLSSLECKLALLVNPNLGPDERRLLMAEIENRSTER